MSWLPLPCLLALLVASTAMGCQYDNPCGDDDFEYARGVCFPRVPEPPPVMDSGADDDAGDGDAAASDGGEAASDPRCEATCDLIGRCVAGNSDTVAILGGELAQLGFQGTDATGCVDRCSMTNGGPGDDAALGCFQGQNQIASCSQGLVGALPAVNAVNECCEDAMDSEFCTYLCGLLNGNPDAAGFFGSCMAFAP